MSTIAIDVREKMLFNIVQGKEGIVLLKGVSMEPVLLDGAILYVRGQNDYYIGDIVVFSYPGEGYLVHRIINMDRGAILCKGDNSKRIEVIRKSQIIGKVVQYVNGELHK